MAAIIKRNHAEDAKVAVEPVRKVRKVDMRANIFLKFLAILAFLAVLFFMSQPRLNAAGRWQKAEGR
ncbi:MAG: hypothetical protein A2X67_02230 [Ignavibacteria bacterium GWA2_55_11]|nr:MAG: hypothetical protein A2X67_02230 [Ignavibacteria bacterium GWA2_55_11]